MTLSRGTRVGPYEIISALGVGGMFPFGVLRLDGKLFWLAQFSGWDRERYVVIEIGRKTVDARINVYGGGC